MPLRAKIWGRNEVDTINVERSVERNRWLQVLIILLSIIAGLYLLSLVWTIGVRFADIILPFFLAWLLAFTLNPIVGFLVARRVPQPLAITLVYVLVLISVIGVFVIAIPPLVDQAIQLGRSFPGYVEQTSYYLQGVQNLLNERGVNFQLSSLVTNASLVQRAEIIGAALAANALAIAGGFASVIFNAVIVIILSFYFLMDGDRINRLIVEVVPARWSEEVKFFSQSTNRSFGGFMRGLLVQSLVYGAGTALVMIAAGLPYVAVLSIFAALIMIIPFVGSVIALIPPLLMAALTGDWVKVLLVFIGLMLLQQLVLNVITPKVMSDNVGMHPLLIFAAVLIGAKEAGAWGAVFGVPFAGVIWSMVVFIYRQRRRRPIILKENDSIAGYRDDHPGISLASSK